MKLKNSFCMPDDYKSNGCGSEKALVDLVPDTIYRVSIFEACRRHDYAYSIGITQDDKDKADIEFLVNLLIIINRVEKWFYPTKLARLRAVDYYSAVVDYGDDAFYNKGDD